jgi:hypothetical protein
MHRGGDHLLLVAFVPAPGIRPSAWVVTIPMIGAGPAPAIEPWGAAFPPHFEALFGKAVYGR